MPARKQESLKNPLFKGPITKPEEEALKELDRRATTRQLHPKDWEWARRLIQRLNVSLLEEMKK